jgi:hypothetical protein
VFLFIYLHFVCFFIISRSESGLDGASHFIAYLDHAGNGGGFEIPLLSLDISPGRDIPHRVTLFPVPES